MSPLEKKYKLMNVAYLESLYKSKIHSLEAILMKISETKDSSLFSVLQREITQFKELAHMLREKEDPKLLFFTSLEKNSLRNIVHLRKEYKQKISLMSEFPLLDIEVILSCHSSW